jgi:HSP20 family protein
MSPIIRKSELSGSTLLEGRHEILHTISWQVRANVWSPPTDFYETEDAYVVRVEIAGMQEDNFEVTVENNILLITGVRPDISERRAYHQMEIRFGKFATAVGLPGPVDLERATAEYKDGFLTVTLPVAKPNQIKVE